MQRENCALKQLGTGLLETPIRVLTIDGGGMRGIYTAAFLHGLAHQFAKDRKVEALDIGKGFDLIVGTSTGAIIGCAAAVGLPMKTVVDLYREHGKAIFPQKIASGGKVVFQIPGRSHHLRNGAAALKKALTAVLGDETLGSMYERRRIALSIPAVEMSQQKSWVFKTSHWGGHRDDNVTLVDACMATSAAPIFRSLAAVPNDDGFGGYRVFADGGLWANNPALVGLIDALGMDNARPIQVISAGTIPRPQGSIIGLDDLDRGFIQWKFGGDAASLGIAAQESAFDFLSKFLAEQFTALGRAIEVHRFPTGTLQPAVLPYLDLDDTSEAAADALMTQASADVNAARSACKRTDDPTGKAVRDLFNSMPPIRLE